MKCHWCERETDNEPEEVVNGYLERALVVFCDRCKKANEVADQEENDQKETQRGFRPLGG